MKKRTGIIVLFFAILCLLFVGCGDNSGTGSTTPPTTPPTDDTTTTPPADDTTTTPPADDTTTTPPADDTTPPPATEPDTTAPPDTTPPTVISTAPVDGATDVAINTGITAITATFSEAMDPASITTANFTVNFYRDSNVSGTVSYSENTATFTPTGGLIYNAVYAATVTTGVKDLAGNAMTADYSWSFTTLPAPKWTLAEDHHIVYIDNDDSGTIYASGFIGDSLDYLFMKTTTLFIAKFSPDGAETVWTKTITSAYGTYVSFAGMEVLGNSVFVIRYDDNSPFLEEYDTGNSDLLASNSIPTCSFSRRLEVDANGIYIAGYDSSSIACFMKINHDYGVAWVKYLDLHSPSGYRLGEISAIISNGADIYLTGTRGYNDDAKGNDAFTAKYDTSGNNIWWNEWGSGDHKYDYGQAIAIDADGNLLAGIRTVNGETGPEGPGYVLKYDSAGNLTSWLAQLGTGQYPRGVAADGLGSVYLTTSTNGPVKINSDGSTAWSGSDPNWQSDILFLDNTLFIINENNALSCCSAETNVIHRYTTDGTFLP